jgi:predicted phosphohydrolase
MKTLMGISTLNENKSNIVVELTKLGPDNKVYAIIRENHEYYIKSTDKVSNIVSEDFKYIGGLQKKKTRSIFFIC